MRSNKQKIILTLKIFLIVFVLGIIAVFIFRNSILETAISKVQNKLKRDYNCELTIKEAKFNGLSNLEFQQITLVPKNADTLVNIENLNTSVNLWKIIIGDLQLGKLQINNGFIQLVKNKHGKNFDAFLKSKTDQKSDQKGNYAKLAYPILSQTFDLIPTDMSVKGFEFRIDDMGNKVVFDFKKLALEDKKLATIINVKADNFSQDWSISGFADPRDRKADLKFFNTNNDTILIPYLDKKFNLKASFKTIHFNMEDMDMSGGKLHLDGFASIERLAINHPKIATKDVVITNAKFDYHFLIGERFVAIDSTSQVQFNDIKFNPYISYTNDSDKIYALKIAIPKMKAQDFITSLPEGLFRHFKGMEATGNFSYNLNFKYQKSKPNAIVFESKLTPENIKILKYGEADLNKLNSQFTYRAIDNGIPQRPIIVGPSNSYFTPLSQISPYLQKCVLTSEDPSFFNHRGFINEAFKQSIVKNIKTKKFSRGASTISMQLVKNVFLTREKTLSRKLEEILLVYVLENNRIASKNRMLEVYFNIIEWGPNVYGIGEAASFYFQKSPAELSLNECLFLATIIPKPKGFMARIDAQHNLKSYAKQQDDFLTRIMLRRNLISSNDTIGLFPVSIIGPATRFLKPKVEIQIDSTATEEFNF